MVQVEYCSITFTSLNFFQAIEWQRNIQHKGKNNSVLVQMNRSTSVQNFFENFWIQFNRSASSKVKIQRECKNLNISLSPLGFVHRKISVVQL